MHVILACAGIMLNAIMLGTNLATVGVGTGAHEGTHCWIYHHIQQGRDDCSITIMAPGAKLLPNATNNVTGQGWDAYFYVEAPMPPWSHWLVYAVEGLAILGTLLPGFALQAPWVAKMGSKTYIPTRLPRHREQRP